jgi:hypothetical protein
MTNGIRHTYTPQTIIILLLNTLEMNVRHIWVEFIQIWPFEINGKLKILIQESLWYRLHDSRESHTLQAKDCLLIHGLVHNLRSCKVVQFVVTETQNRVISEEFYFLGYNAV